MEAACPKQIVFINLRDNILSCELKSSREKSSRWKGIRNYYHISILAELGLQRMNILFSLKFYNYPLVPTNPHYFMIIQ